MNFKNIIRQIAKQNGVTPAEVKRDIQEAIRIGMASSDPNVQAIGEKYHQVVQNQQLMKFLHIWYQQL